MLVIKTKSGTTIQGPDTMAFQLLALRRMLMLEIKGLHHSRGSAYTKIKRTFGLTGNREKVLTLFTEILQANDILVEGPKKEPVNG